MTQKFEIPSKIFTYIKTLEIRYRKNQERLLHDIICNASVFVKKAVSCAYGWNGVNYGYTVILFLDEEIIEKISVKIQKELSSKIKDDLKTLTQHIQNEFIEFIVIELSDEGNPDYTSSVKLVNQPIVNLNNLDIWKPGYIRLFISHRDRNKEDASLLANSLDGYGISSFVANDTIKSLEDWEETIVKALQTMDIMLVFITDGFFESYWTNQEIGFALGKGTPIISLKLEKDAPKGFIRRTQAIIGSLDSNEEIVNDCYKILTKLNQEEKIRNSLVNAFVNSTKFSETIVRFGRLQLLEKITESDIKKIIDGFAENDQLYNCGYLAQDSRFLTFLKSKTGANYKIKSGSVLKVVEEDDSEEIPF